MGSKFYLNGQEVQTPVLTKLEKKLAKQLSTEEFGDNEPWGYISVSDGSQCSYAGLERVNQIKWDGGRKQLGGLLTSLQEKKLIVIDDTEDEYGLEIWFDCEVLSDLSQD